MAKLALKLDEQNHLTRLKRYNDHLTVWLEATLNTLLTGPG